MTEIPSHSRLPVTTAANSAGTWSFLPRVGVCALAIGVWFWTQSLIGARAVPPSGVGDGLHNLTIGLNAYLQHKPTAANALLIVSSALIDALGLFLLGSWVFAGRARPFLGLMILLGLRQIAQALCALPAPPNMIWHYPGFPSLFVTYNVANDYFFSGHTGIAVFGAIELARFHRTWLTVLAVIVVAFEMSAVLVLRAHYTMDVFTGMIAALWVAGASDWLSQHFERHGTPNATN